MLEVVNLGIDFGGGHQSHPVVRDVSFTLAAGETLGIVGESGSGKSVTARAIAGLLPPGGRIESGTIRLNGIDLASMSDFDRRRLLGTEIGMIFQDPLGSLNPVIRVGDQISEGLRKRLGMTRTQARARALELMDAVRIPTPDRNYSAYPHEFSGGMRQRVMIAIGLSLNPKLVIADEPTTALDVTVAAQILDLLSELCREHDAALILISHDVRTVKRVTQELLVMYAGRIVESGSTAELSTDPLHPYTRGLLGSVPSHDHRPDRLPAIEGYSASSVPLGETCAFAPRCTVGISICTTKTPVLAPVGTSGRCAACFVVQGVGDESD